MNKWIDKCHEMFSHLDFEQQIYVICITTDRLGRKLIARGMGRLDK